MNAARRRPRPARQDWERRGELRVLYVSLYANDPEFQEALLDVDDAHCATQRTFLANSRSMWDVHEVTWRGWPPPMPSREWAQAYLASVSEMAERFGLHRL